MFLIRWATISLSKMTVLHEVIFSNYLPRILYFTLICKPFILSVYCQDACWQVHCNTELNATEKQPAIVQVFSVQFVTAEALFPSQSRACGIFGGRRASENGFSSSTSVFVITKPSQYFGVRLSIPHFPSTSVFVCQHHTIAVLQCFQYHNTTILRRLAVPHYPRTSVFVCQYHTTPVLRCMSFLHQPSTSVFVCEYHTTPVLRCLSISTTQPQYFGVCLSVPHHQFSRLVFIHL